MWISRPPGHGTPTRWRRALEAFGPALALASAAELAGVRARAVLEPHPGWIAVIVLAARYGTEGFFAGLIAVVGAIAIGSAVAGTGPTTSWSRLDSGPNLAAVAACLTVSWIASWHLRRQGELSERLRSLSDRAAEAEGTIVALRDLVATLRARVDRTSTSLSFLRDVAARLDGTNPVAAAHAAADLALARSAARAAAIHAGTGELGRPLAFRDARGPKALAPLALHDADVTVPIRVGNDRIGVIALWGIPGSTLDAATAHDMKVIASWCAPALATTWRPKMTARTTVEVT